MLIFVYLFVYPFVYPRSNECSDISVTDETIHRPVKKRLIKRSCINDLHFHDLRHEAISRFIERGLTIPEAASISGHKTQSMLLELTHPDFSYIKKKVMSF
jgi:integrase